MGWKEDCQDQTAAWLSRSRHCTQTSTLFLYDLWCTLNPSKRTFQGFQNCGLSKAWSYLRLTWLFFFFFFNLQPDMVIKQSATHVRKLGFLDFGSNMHAWGTVILDVQIWKNPSGFKRAGAEDLWQEQNISQGSIKANCLSLCTSPQFVERWNGVANDEEWPSQANASTWLHGSVRND